MFCCLTARTARALLCMADAEFGIQVIAEAVVACPYGRARPSLTSLFPLFYDVVDACASADFFVGDTVFPEDSED